VPQLQGVGDAEALCQQVAVLDAKNLLKKTKIMQKKKLQGLGGRRRAAPASRSARRRKQVLRLLASLAQKYTS
jgi:hypothetical protein